MIKIKPSDIILAAEGGSASRPYDSVEWWMAYEWFCRQLMKFQPNDTKYEILNATSSINNSNFNICCSIDTPVKRLSYMLKRGWPQGQEEFLATLGIENWSDLDKTIRIQGLKPKIFPENSWFEMQGRSFKKPGPNNCHQDATTVHCFGLQFSSYQKLWYAKIEYGYPHDSSSWHVGLKQKKKEKLDVFAERIDMWLNSVLWPDIDPQLRIQQERTWQIRYSAAQELFYANDIYDFEDVLADILSCRDDVGIASTLININKRRFATLRKWALAN